jgi:hypothetical protein
VDVAVIGVGMTSFGKFPELGIKEQVTHCRRDRPRN